MEYIMVAPGSIKRLVIMRVVDLRQLVRINLRAVINKPLGIEQLYHASYFRAMGTFCLKSFSYRSEVGIAYSNGSRPTQASPIRRPYYLSKFCPK
jgi:S-methylmethionine-dependent homocysteine/selenocysteine methylase